MQLKGRPDLGRGKGALWMGILQRGCKLYRYHARSGSRSIFQLALVALVGQICMVVSLF